MAIATKTPRIYVPWNSPDEYQVFLHPSDYAQLDDRKDQTELEKFLAGYLIEIARQSGATLMRRPQVRIHLCESIPFRQVQVQACLTSPPALADEPFQTREFDVPASQEVNRGPAADASPSNSASPPVPSQAALTGTSIQTYHLSVDERFFSLVTSPVNLGRGLDNDLVINHPRVSRHHAQLQQREGQWWLIDLGSANGTAVNDLPVSEMILQPGDVISLAASRSASSQKRQSTKYMSRALHFTGDQYRVSRNDHSRSTHSAEFDPLCLPGPGFPGCLVRSESDASSGRASSTRPC